MKKKIAILLCTAMVLCLAGCSNTSNKTNTDNNQPNSQVAIKKNVSTKVGKTGYAGIMKAGKNSFVVQEETGGSYTIVDIEGNKVLEDEFDYFNMDLEGDYYAVGKKITNEDQSVSYQYFLYDGENQRVFENTDYRDYHIYRYNNGILQLRKDIISEGTDGKQVKTYECVYLDGNNGFAKMAYLGDNIDCQINFLSNYSNGFAAFSPTRLVTVNATTKLYSLINTTGDLLEITLSNGCIGRSFNTSISANGWILVDAINKQTVKSEGTYFYNVLTKEEVLWPSGYDSWESFYDAGFGAVFTVNNYVAVTPAVKQNADAQYDIFDLSKGEIVSKLGVASIDLRTYDSGLMVVKKSSQFAYVDQNFEVKSEWYVSAADIVNGYGLIVDNGTVYVINEKFAKEAVVTAGEVVAYIGDNYYSIKHDGKYYLAEVTPLNNN